MDQKKLWKIFQEMGIPDHFSCFLRNLYVGQEATVRTRHRTMDWFQIGKGVRQGCILSPCLFNLYAKYITQNVRLYETQAGIKSARKNTITSDIKKQYPIGRNLRGTKMLLDEGEREIAGLKLNIQKTKITASGPVTSWQIDGETNRWGNSVKIFFFLGPKITLNGTCSHEIKRCLFLGRKTMMNLDSIFKSRDITLLTKPIQSKL